MFKDSDAFSGFSVDDIEKAKDFYGSKLGIDVEMSDAGLALRIPGRRPVFIYPKDNHQPASYTVLNFPVESVDAAVDQLAAAGVQMEHYDPEMGQDEKGIARDPRGPVIAWFKDPAGNILSVLEGSPE